MGGMVELFLAPLITKVIEVIYDYSKDQIRWQRGMKKELQKLVDILPQIQAVASAYSQVEIKDPALNIWYWQLRDAIDEADDVLDEIEHRKLEKQASKNKKTKKVRSLVKSIKKRVGVIIKRALKLDSYLKRLEMAVQKLNEISCWASIFIHLVENKRQEEQQQQLQLHRTREAGSLIKNVLLGRSKEIETVSQWLRKPYEAESADTADLYKNISLLSVVGLGGMGKTTLLQHVYKDATLLQDVNKDEIKEGFHIKLWVCVSTNFDAQTVIKNMLESLKQKTPDQETLESLQTSLQSEVKNKRFLLVLDDIWEANEENWKDVFAALQHGNPGSKILISTRIPSVASTFAKMIKNNQIYQLKGLEKDDCLQLFNKHAFSGIKNPGGKFGDIAEEMIEKLSWCPLAIKFIGDFLNTCVDEVFWTNVLKTDIGKLKLEEPSQNYLLPILKLSYRHLPGHLQNCFSFCCIFPQDHEFDKDDLVRMWIAVGFIQSSDIPGETLENTGRRYFNILVQKSFFDEFHTDNFQPYYKMHDLLHDLAQSVSMQECLRVVGDEKLSIPETIRHLSIVTPNLEVLKEMNKFKHLRSLFLYFSKVAEFENVISQILKASKSLRLLVIDAPNNNYTVPEKIDRLIHLRYLKIDCGVLKLSRSISHLCHLQFVVTKRPQNLVMDNISWEELRPNKNCHLIMDELFIEDLNSVLLMEPQRSISYLRFLVIEKNDNLVSFSSEAELWFLQHSSTLLQLKFQNLKSLQSLPPLSSFSSLTYLTLQNIPLLKSMPDLPSSLKKLELYDIKSFERLPSSLSAIPSLETLELHHIPLLKSLPDLPSSLKELQLRKFKSLESLPSSLSAIPSLETLHLHDIPLLKSLPDLPSSLKILKLNHFKSLESLPSSLSAIPSLETLDLCDIPLLKSLPDLPSSLKELKLYYMESLESLPSSLSAIPSLETLQLFNIPLLKSLPDLPSSLKELRLWKFKSLESLPSSLSAIPFLETLHLHDIPLLKSLPDLPSSLKKLELYYMESLESLPSSLSAIPSLQTLELYSIPLLKSLTGLPSSLEDLYLEELQNLDCLPSCLPTRLRELEILKVRQLLELPDLSASLEVRYIEECDPQLMERYPNFGSRSERSSLRNLKKLL